jgi:ribose transport system permease protein
MNRILGVSALVVILFGTLLALDFDGASSPGNLQNLARRTGLYGIITIGVGLLIISGGIDLSIGAVVGLSAVTLALRLEQGTPPWLAMAEVVAMSLAIGFVHGLLVTKLRLQPFIVTLCGLFIYRGLAQWLTRTDKSPSRDVGIGGLPHQQQLHDLAAGTLGGIPVILLFLLGLAVVAALILHFSVYGRYLYAIGFNEQAARYAGIATDRYKIFAYVWCSLLAGVGGMVYLLDVETASPSGAGTLYELYAITGAVLGGCSLRGGQGNVAGMLLGTAVLPLLRNLCNFANVPTTLEYTYTGVALLLGTIADELLKRRAAKKR